MANIRIGHEWEEFCDQALLEFLDYNITVGQVEVITLFLIKGRYFVGKYYVVLQFGE